MNKLFIQLTNEKFVQWYQDYIELIKLGKTHEEAMMEFAYLDAQTFLQFNEYVLGEV